jgi:hypothetical protein
MFHSLKELKNVKIDVASKTMRSHVPINCERGRLLCMDGAGTYVGISDLPQPDVLPVD